MKSLRSIIFFIGYDQVATYERQASILLWRHRVFGDNASLERAIDLLQLAVDDTCTLHPRRTGRLNRLGAAIITRFNCTSDMNLVDLARAVSAFQSAYDACADECDEKDQWLERIKDHLVQLTTLAAGLHARFDRIGGDDLIEEALVALQLATVLTPDDDNAKAGRLSNLGLAYLSRFTRMGDLLDLEYASTASEKAIELTPAYDPDIVGRINGLASIVRSRFQCVGALSDLDRAIVLSERVVNLTLDEDREKPGYLSNLAVVSRARFERLGNIDDINHAVAMSRRAVELDIHDGRHRAHWLNNLSLDLRARFSRLGSLQDLEEAVVSAQRSVELTENESPKKAHRLACLSDAFAILFERVGDILDLDNAIAAAQRAVDLSSAGQPNYASRLNSLGSCLQTRYTRMRRPEDIDMAMSAARLAVKATPEGHPSYAFFLNTLGKALLSRFEYVNEPSDLENAISTFQHAIESTPHGHPNTPSWLHGLATALQTRFKLLHEDVDITKAIGASQKAVGMLPQEHASASTQLATLGLSFYLRFKHSDHIFDLDSALDLFQRASFTPTAPPSSLLSAAILWSQLHTLKHGNALSHLPPYERVLELIPQVVWLGQNIRRRYYELAILGDVINAAVAAAVAAKRFEQAVVFHESGRTIVWGQMLALRTPLDNLRAIDSRLADDLEGAARSLELAGLSVRVNEDSEQVDSAVLTSDAEARKHRDAASRYEELLARVRKLDGFANFLRPKAFAELAEAALNGNGHVIIVNSHLTRCDALVLSPFKTIVHVPLPSPLSMKLLHTMRARLVEHLRASGVRERSMYRGAVVLGKSSKLMHAVLRCLWLYVVQPILLEIKEELWDLAGHYLPHVTWCATGPLAFMPLHAAGIYTGPHQIAVHDFVVSSYAPSLTSLIDARHKAQHFSHAPSTLIISLSDTPGYTPLLGTENESATIKSRLKERHPLSFHNASATVDAVLGALPAHPWVHVACHGIQHPKDPTQSSFLLYDGHLTLSRLMAQSLPHAELAFLSACQTATGDEALPEEAVHLGAGMLAVGFRSVVGTMWSIGDADAPIVADTFYEALLRNEGSTQKGVAYALHEATSKLREHVGVDEFIKWVPFIHLGV